MPLAPTLSGLSNLSQNQTSRVNLTSPLALASFLFGECIFWSEIKMCYNEQKNSNPTPKWNPELEKAAPNYRRYKGKDGQGRRTTKPRSHNEASLRVRSGEIVWSGPYSGDREEGRRRDPCYNSSLLPSDHFLPAHPFCSRDSGPLLPRPRSQTLPSPHTSLHAREEKRAHEHVRHGHVWRFFRLLVREESSSSCCCCFIPFFLSYSQALFYGSYGSSFFI